VVQTLLFLLASLLAGGVSGADDSALPTGLSFKGRWEQGGLVVGTARPGTQVWLGEQALRVAPDGRFVFGFHRDAPAQAELLFQLPDGERQRYRHAVIQRQYREQRIDGLPEGMVSPPADVQARIDREAAAVQAARLRDSAREDFAHGFVWPAKGKIKSVYGSQRILNGVPKQPHYGLDIAAPVGTPVVAAAAGVVALAEADLYYTGGTIMLDHGAGVSSVYLHLSKLSVKAGQTVRQGETIGAMGATGRATGPHLCFRFNWFDARLDPALLLPGPRS
jgi:murein DD-endopeptidase MepM/ murein hydrolase activator NlpD